MKAWKLLENWKWKTCFGNFIVIVFVCLDASFFFLSFANIVALSLRFVWLQWTIISSIMHYTKKITYNLNVLGKFQFQLISPRFRFRVTVEIEEKSRVLVAFGEPRLRKKDAAEHAAEGALWFLKKDGYLQD